MLKDAFKQHRIAAGSARQRQDCEAGLALVPELARLEDESQSAVGGKFLEATLKKPDSEIFFHQGRHFKVQQLREK